jgi:hypothetical protein
MSLVTIMSAFALATKANCQTNDRPCNTSCHVIVTRSDNLLVYCFASEIRNTMGNS